MYHRSLTARATALAAILWVAAAGAATLRVPQDYATIALALEQAAADDSVLVDQGTYLEHDLVIPAGVHLSGSSPSPESTVIDAQQQGRVLTISGGDTQVMNLRLTGGEHARGGGLLVDAGTASLSSVTIDGCRADAGGGLFAAGGSVVLQDCGLIGNVAETSGGGVHAAPGATVLLDGSLILENRAGALGGAWYAGLASLSVNSCTVVDNQAPLGAEGAAFGQSPVAVDHAIAVGNGSDDGGGDLGGLLYSDRASRTQNTCTLRWDPDHEAWTGYLAEQLGQALGNLEADPLFCGGEGSWPAYFGLAANSPALGLDDDCGLRGAFGQACGPVGTPDVPVLVDRLHAAYPNPFNPSTTLLFDVARAGPTRLVIYSLDGRRVATLVNAELDAGRHEATWLGRDGGGRQVASGVYLARLVTPSTRHAVRLTLVK